MGKTRDLFKKMRNTVRGKHTDWSHPSWPATTVAICMRCFTTGGPGKEHGTNKPPPARRVQEKSKGDTTCLTTSPKPSLWHSSWLSKACTIRKDSESEWLVKDNPETNPITINLRLLAMWQSCSPGFPYPAALCRVPFPSKISCFVSTCVSLENSFLSVRQEPTFRS